MTAVKLRGELAVIRRFQRLRESIVEAITVRRCKTPGCTSLFFRSDPRQKYCTPQCGRRFRWERFAPTRTRNYSEEYARRKARAKP